MDAVYLAEMQRWTNDPWEESVTSTFMESGANWRICWRIYYLETADELQLLELTCCLTLNASMFTSCGWFFEDFDRIEPRNVVAYAMSSLVNVSGNRRKEPGATGNQRFRPVESWVSGLPETGFWRASSEPDYFEKLLPPM